MLKTYYDKKNNRLVQIGYPSNVYFWEKHWIDNPVSMYSKMHSFIVPIIKKFLQNNSTILDGGCGLGVNVYLLKKAGYNVVGIDYAKETVANINKSMPLLDIRCGDVKRLPFQDGCFDGYLSLGVIEHFYEGYDLVIKEIKRVLKDKGFVFVVFPFISLLRRIKINFNCYPLWEENIANNFYQFIFDPYRVIDDFSKNGFKVSTVRFYDAVKCIKDEIKVTKYFLQYIYDSKNLYIKAIKYMIDKVLSRMAGHIILVVFSKN